MRFSTWNQSTGMFDYYDTPDEQAKLNTEKPSHIGHRTLGATVDQAAWPLPANARKVGSGDHAIGRIATRKSSAVGSIDFGEPTFVKIGALAGVAYLLWKYVVPKRRFR